MTQNERWLGPSSQKAPLPLPTNRSNPHTEATHARMALKKNDYYKNLKLYRKKINNLITKAEINREFEYLTQRIDAMQRSQASILAILAKIESQLARLLHNEY